MNVNSGTMINKRGQGHKACEIGHDHWCES